MPIQFACPYCGRLTNVADQYAGQSGPCAGCGKTITVPGPGGAAPMYAPPAKSGGMSTVAIVLVVLLVLAVFCGGILMALLLPAVQAAREAARRSQCTNNMKQIALAMHNYHDTYKTFPPAFIPDENGNPKHSWRTLILPFMDQKPLFDRYDFNQAWDSPANRRWTTINIPVFHCPSDGGSAKENAVSTETNYVMIVGPKTISDGPGARNFGKITDGSSNTIMIVEVTGLGIDWAEPKDLSIDELVMLLDEPGNGSRHPGVFNVAFCDGSVRAVSKTVSLEELKKMAEINDGQAIGGF